MITVYVLRSLKDGKYYIGQTNNIDDRLSRHNKGKVLSTKYRRPLKLIYKEEFISRSKAIRREINLKSYKSHKYIERIINRGLVV